MCQSAADGGRRCATHAREGFQRAEAAMATAPDLTRRQVAVMEWDRAAAEYAATPTGRRDLSARAQACAGEGEVEEFARITAALRRGDTLRAAAAETRRRVRVRARGERRVVTGRSDLIAVLDPARNPDLDGTPAQVRLPHGEPRSGMLRVFEGRVDLTSRGVTQLRGLYGPQNPGLLSEQVAMLILHPRRGA